MARHALLIGVSEFTDKRLDRLNAPTNDVLALRRILQDSSRGGFDSVDLSVNEDFLAIRDRLGRFYQDKAPDDLLLLYYSGHGILGRGNRLFLATNGSNIDAPRERSISARDIRDLMDDCRSERQVVVLDCCHSGAFAENAKAGGAAPAVTADTFASGEAGIYVLTAADALQFAWDGDNLQSGTAPAGRTSRFTAWLVDGLEQGEAAPDQEQITMDALYRYLFHRARAEGAASTPQRFVHGGVGDPAISRNPLAGAARVDPATQAALAAQDYRLRLGAVTELVQQMRGTDKPAAHGARLLLARHLEQERDFLVRRAITDALDTGSRPAEPKPESRPAADNATPPPSFVSGTSAAPGVAATIDRLVAALPVSDLSARWRAVPWWVRIPMFLFWPIGVVWLVARQAEPVPRWLKISAVVVWVVAVAVVFDGIQNQP
ncbi:MAG TPA: caspase family protein [Acetobacteraceae bacterium]|nr:caspase family protein [Acetobacteraceae bacterium]